MAWHSPMRQMHIFNVSSNAFSNVYFYRHNFVASVAGAVVQLLVLYLSLFAVLLFNICEHSALCKTSNDVRIT